MITIPEALVCFVLVTMSYAQDSPRICDLSKTCKQVTPLQLSLDKYVGYSPFYELINQYRKNDTEGVGACLTFFRINNSTFLVFRHVLLKCGGTNLEIYMSSGIEGTLGMFRLQGLINATSGNSTTVLNAYVVGSGCKSCNGRFFLYYACYLLDAQDYVYPKDEIVFSAFTTPDAPSSCLDQYEKLLDQLGFSHSEGFARSSGPLPKCITRFNNNTCINAEKVDPADAMSYP